MASSLGVKQQLIALLQNIRQGIPHLSNSIAFLFLCVAEIVNGQTVVVFVPGFVLVLL